LPAFDPADIKAGSAAYGLSAEQTFAAEAATTNYN